MSDTIFVREYQFNYNMNEEWVFVEYELTGRWKTENTVIEDETVSSSFYVEVHYKPIIKWSWTRFRNIEIPRTSWIDECYIAESVKQKKTTIINNCDNDVQEIIERKRNVHKREDDKKEVIE